jgi:uncharacterized membrane protein
MAGNPVTGEKSAKETSRLEAFSDGVFAIAITLLALEIKVPHLAGAELTARGLAFSLVREWPSYLAFVTSFFTVLVMWVHHHVMFRMVARADAKLLFANGLLLMLVTLVPFPTAVVAEFWRTPAESIAVTFYCGVFVLISVAFFLLRAAAFRDSMLDRDASRATVARLRKSYRLGPPLYILAMIAAPFGPWLAMGICSALWILWAMTTREC